MKLKAAIFTIGFVCLASNAFAQLPPTDVPDPDPKNATDGFCQREGDLMADHFDTTRKIDCDDKICTDKGVESAKPLPQRLLGYVGFAYLECKYEAIFHYGDHATYALRWRPLCFEVTSYDGCPGQVGDICSYCPPTGPAMEVKFTRLADGQPMHEMKGCSEFYGTGPSGQLNSNFSGEFDGVSENPFDVLNRRIEEIESNAFLATLTTPRDEPVVEAGSGKRFAVGSKKMCYRPIPPTKGNAAQE